MASSCVMATVWFIPSFKTSAISINISSSIIHTLNTMSSCVSVAAYTVRIANSHPLGTVEVTPVGVTETATVCLLSRVNHTGDTI